MIIAICPLRSPLTERWVYEPTFRLEELTNEVRFPLPISSTLQPLVHGKLYAYAVLEAGYAV